MKISLLVLLLVIPPAALYAQPGYIEVNTPGNGFIITRCRMPAIYNHDDANTLNLHSLQC
jgi:hypothetical protein